MRHRREELLDEALGQQRRTLCLAGGAEVSGLAGERQEMFGPTRRTADAREASQEPAACEIGLDAGLDHRTQGASAGLEALVVRPEVAVEVHLEELVEGGALGVARAVDARRTRLGAAG